MGDPMKIVVAGGSGHVGVVACRHFLASGHGVTVLSRGRTVEGVRTVRWDGQTLGAWADELEGADVVLNLAGRTVNCRYNRRHLREMRDSRVLSTRILGQAIGRAKSPPRVWLQASTATLYAHTFGPANDEVSGTLGGHEPGAPAKWTASVDIAKAWEAELDAAVTPATRKVALRSAMTMSTEPGSVFHVFAGLARRGLLGRLGDGRQYVSWIHEADFLRALDFLTRRDDVSGPVNIAAPYPVTQAEFARILRSCLRVKVGLAAPSWLVELGTLLMRTESELVLKSRRVVPRRLLESGFEFDFPEWEGACQELVSRL